LSTPEWASTSRSSCGGIGPDASHFNDWIHDALVALGEDGRDESRVPQVNISSITPSAPIAAPQASAPKTTDPTVDAFADDAGAAQPTPPPPLPPGQGTRVDQLA